MPQSTCLQRKPERGAQTGQVRMFKVRGRKCGGGVHRALLGSRTKEGPGVGTREMLVGIRWGGARGLVPTLCRLR